MLMRKRLLLQVVERLRNLERGGVRVLGEDGFLHLGLERADGLAAGGFGGVVDGGLDAVAGDLVSDLLDLVADGEQSGITRFSLPAWLARSRWASMNFWTWDGRRRAPR